MRKGFTLVELLIVIAIIAILAAIAVPQYTKYVRKAAAANAQATLTSCLSAAQAQFADEGNKTYTCHIDLGNGTTTTVDIKLDDDGNFDKFDNLGSGIEYVTTGSGNSTANVTSSITLEIKGHKVQCDADDTTNTIYCKPTT